MLQELDAAMAAEVSDLDTVSPLGIEHIPRGDVPKAPSTPKLARQQSGIKTFIRSIKCTNVIQLVNIFLL